MPQNNNQRLQVVPDQELDEESLISAVADAIASLEDNDPTEISPLYYTLNTDAINALFDSSANESYLRLEFTHDEYEITIEKDSSITVSVNRA